MTSDGSNNDFMTYWLKMDDIQSIVKKLEGVLQYEYHLSLKSFMYFTIFLLRLTKIKITRTTKLILLSQSALSKL